jgi:hypothetical protein
MRMGSGVSLSMRSSYLEPFTNIARAIKTIELRWAEHIVKLEEDMSVFNFFSQERDL